MNIIRFALRKPIAIMVVVMALAYFSFSVIKKIKVDIFPEIESPAMYIAMPYGGLSPAYMDGFMANEFQKVLVFVSGVKDIDFKSVQGLTLMKLTFYPGTDMSQASAELSMQVSRAMGFLPAGAVPPMVVRFDGSSLPVGQLVFESPKRTITELQTLAITRVRPMFVNIPGITAPAPFGGNMRSIVINIDPQKMAAHGLNPEEVTLAITKNSLPSPAGNVRIGQENLMAPVNSISKGPEEFLRTPVKMVNDRTIFVGDVATVEDAADQTVGYALVNGKRSVYLPIIKKPDASTLKAVDNLKKSIPMLKSALPDDVQVNYEFDQSVYIQRSLSNLVVEGILGAILTGLMVFLFLKDTRGALIVVLTIPIAILSAVLGLHLFGQTINIMTLSGLALSIGILVDEATVTIENIHQHFELKKSKPRAILDALLEISIPKLLILLSILAVLTPALMMTGIPKDMFMPLSISVALAMIASFVASQTFVPILANWLMKIKVHDHKRLKRTGFDKFKIRYAYFIGKVTRKKSLLAGIYILATASIISVALSFLGTDIMPVSNGGDIQIRLQAKQGSRLENTELLVNQITKKIKQELPEGALNITSAFVGVHPSANPINPIFLFTSTSSEAVLQLSFNKKVVKQSAEELKEKIRGILNKDFSNVQYNFEPIELMEKVIGQGSMTPIEVKVAANQVKEAQKHASKIEKELKKVPFLRDVRIAEPLDYPSLKIELNRELVAKYGLTVQDVSRSLAAATSSTRFTDKNLWVDPRSGLVFQVQVQIPEGIMNSENRLKSLPLKKGNARPILDDVATISRVNEPAHINRKGPNRYVTIVANMYQKDLGTANKAVDKAIANAGEAQKGVRIWKEGTLRLLLDTLEGLKEGLVVAIVVIFLMMSAYYQSFKVAGVILSVIPAVLAGSLLSVWLSGSTLNLQSYMGIIMSIGVSVSNAVLLINQAEFYRKTKFLGARQAAQLAASSRLRPVLMTAAAMVAGMIPMALGMGDGGEQVAPLGQAVIGGLVVSTVTILLFIPTFFTAAMQKASYQEPSLDPDDETSKFYKQ